MTQVILVMHEKNGDYYRMNKTSFEKLPVIGEHIYNNDGLTYLIEDVVSLAGYESAKAVTALNRLLRLIQSVNSTAWILKKTLKCN